MSMPDVRVHQTWSTRNYWYTAHVMDEGWEVAQCDHRHRLEGRAWDCAALMARAWDRQRLKDEAR